MMASCADLTLEVQLEMLHRIFARIEKHHDAEVGLTYQNQVLTKGIKK